MDNKTLHKKLKTKSAKMDAFAHPQQINQQYRFFEVHEKPVQLFSDCARTAHSESFIHITAPISYSIRFEYGCTLLHATSAPSRNRNERSAASYPASRHPFLDPRHAYGEPSAWTIKFCYSRLNVYLAWKGYLGNAPTMADLNFMHGDITHDVCRLISAKR